MFKNIYLFFYRLWFNHIATWPSEVKYFMQRGRRGFSDRDLWGINFYLSDIIPKMLRKLADNHFGCPVDFFDESRKQDECHLWRKELIRYAEGWEAIAKVLNDEHIVITPLPKGEARSTVGRHSLEPDWDSKFDEKQMNAWIKQFEDIGPSFFKNFLGLWD